MMNVTNTQGGSNPTITDAWSKLKDVATSLGKYKLDYLIKFSSFLSIMSYLSLKYQVGTLQLWKLFNPVFGKKFSKAILLSNSKLYKSRCFQLSDFKNIYNRLAKIDLLVYPPKDVPGSVFIMLASVANTQGYYQDTHLVREIGRALLLYDIIPDRYGLKNEKWIDIFHSFQARYELPITEVYKNVIDIVVHTEQSYCAICYELEQCSEHCLPKALLDTFHSHIDRGDFCTTSIPSECISEINLHALGKYYDSISVPIEKVTELVEGVTPDVIMSDWHPFRARPLVRIAEHHYIVPSIWELVEHVKVFHMPIIDDLSKEEKSQWYTNLGLSYEKYIFDYMVNKHTNYRIIPESNFNKGDLGPDISILDTDAKTGIFIEIKTLSIPLAARNDPLQFDSRLMELVKLVPKLFRKAKRVFCKEGDYAKHSDIIDQCHRENLILVIICGNLGYFFEPRLLHMFKTTYPDFPTDNVLFLDMVSAENLIEYSSQNRMTLCQAFHKNIDIQNGAIKSTNTRDVFSQYDRKLTPWYQICENSGIFNNPYPNS